MEFISRMRTRSKLLPISFYRKTLPGLVQPVDSDSKKMRKYIYFDYIKRIYRKACMNAGFSTLILRIEHLAHEFLHFRIFFIRIAQPSLKRMYIGIDFQAVCFA